MVFGFKNSPQFAEVDDIYQYYFSSSGLASTAGMLQLWLGDNLLDEVCWGKLECVQNVAKFSTSAADNFSYLRGDDGLFAPAVYHPEINLTAIISPEPSVASSCDMLAISEIYTYYIESASEQFIELYNPTEEEISLDPCKIQYKNTTISLSGSLLPGAFFAVRDTSLVFTKDPSTFNTVSISDTSGDILLDFVYPHGQKKGTSYAIFNPDTTDEKWLQTYTPTPGAENTYQQFQACPEGKEINPETGNCIKSKETAAATVCPEGKYLNLLTGRCKKIETATVKICKEGYHLNLLTGRCNKDKTTSIAECAEGYERNPETNRCRKIQTATAQEYPVEPTTEETYASPQIFIAGGAMVALLLGGAGFAVYQFRKEIKTAILKICRRNAS